MSVIIAVVKEDEPIKIGDTVNTTGERFRAIFAEEALGRVTDLFGIDLLTGRAFEKFKYIDIEKPTVPIMDRTPVNRPMMTGIAGIDLIYPIGRGQRQLIIGDKKTGKTQIALDTIVNQGKIMKEKSNKNDIICIYIAVGKTKKEIKTIDGYELYEYPIQVEVGFNQEVSVTVNNKKEEKPQIITNKTASKEIKRLPVTGM